MDSAGSLPSVAYMADNLSACLVATEMESADHNAGIA